MKDLSNLLDRMQNNYYEPLYSIYLFLFIYAIFIYLIIIELLWFK